MRMMQAQLARETTCVQRSYTLRDGRRICMGTERFRAPGFLYRGPIYVGPPCWTSSRLALQSWPYGVCRCVSSTRVHAMSP